MATTYLNRTPSGAGDSNRIFTISLWFKRGTLPGSEQYLFECNEAADNNDNFRIVLAGANNIFIQDTEANTSNLDLRTDRLFRDVNSWYHLVLEVDTTQSTSSDRAKLYINGVQETSFSTETYPSQNYDTNVSQSGEPFVIGRRESTATPTSYFDGSMAHYHFVDGTAYDADTFGETDSTTGEWKPKTNPTVTYGTNGFFLKFENAAAFGEDDSGNDNDFTSNGSPTQNLDTPTNVLCTLNPLRVERATAATYSNGNTTVSISSATGRVFVASQYVSAGKYYAEFKHTTSTNTDAFIGVVSPDRDSSTSTNQDIGYRTGEVSWRDNGDIHEGSSTKSDDESTWTTNDILGIALDMDNKKVYFSKNGTWQNSADPSAGTNGYTLSGDEYVMALDSYSGDGYQANFGNGYFGTTAVTSGNQDDAGHGIFEYDVPTGYYTLNTKNINTYG